MSYEFGWTKQQTYDVALDTVMKFLDHNRIALPVFYTTKAPVTVNKWQTYGLYLRCHKGAPTIFTNVQRTTVPQRTRGRVWSYPGHKSDRTAAGVLAHETGHHVSHIKKIGLTKEWAKLLESKAGKKPITSYEPTREEACAETLRLFILNPDLLRQGRRARYDYLHDVCGLRPFVADTWMGVLSNAPMFIKVAAKNFANGN